MPDSKLKLGTNIKQTSLTVGTGTLTLSSVATFNTFLSQIGEGNQCHYRIIDGLTFKEERGIGKVVGSTLVRENVISSDNSNLPLYLEQTNSVAPHIVLNEPLLDYPRLGTDFHNLQLKSPQLAKYSEVIDRPVITVGILRLNLKSANVFVVNHNQNITQLNLISSIPSGTAFSFTLHLIQDATGGRTVPFPTSTIKYGTNTAPTIATTANKRNKFVFDTIDGGTTWDVGYCGIF